MDKVYYLDLPTLLEYLNGKSALLYTSLKVPKQREICNGSVIIKSGKVINCLIQAPDDKVLYEGQSAYPLLCISKQWSVRLDQQTEPASQSMYEPHEPVQPLSESAIRQPIPGQKQPLTPQLLARFTTKQQLILRMVFAMVNGERTISQIKSQLQLPPEVVEQGLEVLVSLEVIGYIL